MATPGHIAVTNADQVEAAPRIILESGRQRQTNRSSLHYYRPLKRRARIIEESAPAGGAELMGEISLPDVALASFGDSMMLEAVIGNDDRKKVSQNLLSDNPWRQICSLRIHSQSGQTFVGTAWFIAPKVLATAGHCIFLQEDGGWASSIDVVPARFGTSAPFGTLKATRFAAVDGWTIQRSRDFDYGVIFLEDGTVGTKVGNFEVRVLPLAQLMGIDAKISGYPADRDQARFQYFHERPVQTVTATRLVYDVDTFGGQSGSPIWQDTEENGLVAIGIHTTGGISSNSGTLINDAVLKNLIDWTEA